MWIYNQLSAHPGEMEPVKEPQALWMSDKSQKQATAKAAWVSF